MSFDIEIFIDGIWKFGSSHTQESDRDVQYQRFLDNGIPAENLRFK